VPSSTSSFEREVPEGAWGGPLLIALLVTILTTVGVEFWARARGFVPTVVDDTNLWVLHRQRVSDGRTSTVAVIGASRSQLGIMPSVLRESLHGAKVVQLSIDGTAPLATLEDLSNDADFRGTVVMEFNEWTIRSSAWAQQQPWVKAYHRRWRSLGALANRRLASEVQSRLAIFPATGPGLLRAILEERHLSRPPYVTLKRDRWRSANYGKSNLAKLKRWRRKGLADYSPPNPDWRQQLERVAQAVQRIESRGGRVVFLRMPLSGPYLKFAERLYPRKRFWNKIARTTGAETYHFQDYPVASTLAVPDFSHLSAAGAVRYTEELGRLLKSRPKQR